MTTSPYRAFAAVLFSVLALAPGSLAAADEPLGNLVKKFAEKQTGQTAPIVAPVITQPLAAPVPVQTQTTTASGRKPSPPLKSLAPPKVSGPLRILLVDDDASSNNVGGDTGAAQGSDGIFRELVAKAVGGSAHAWSVEVVRNRENGPAFERLRGFNVVLWYTGAAYGANNDTIGREDEKVLRRYLQEVGGAVILVSPGYVNNLVYGQSWDAAEHPFLKEVIAVNGCYGLVQRGARATVRAYSGAEFGVDHPGVAETQFSAVNPDGAALVFTSPLSTAYAKREGGLPVAVASNYGQGRVVYVGFTFENIPETEREKAFSTLLEAAGVGANQAGGVAVTTPPPSAPPTRLPVAIETRETTLKPPPAAPAGPAPESVVAGPGLQKSPDLHVVSWRFPTYLADGYSGAAVNFEVHRRRANGWELVAILPAKNTGRRVSETSTYLRSWIHDDYAFMPLASAYKVVAAYSDGRRGETIAEYPAPPQPGLPSGVRGKQISPDTIRLEWTAGPQECVVFGPRLPANGQPCRGVTFYDVGGLPSGIHEFRVALEYAQNTVGPSGNLVTVRNVAPNFVTIRIGVNAVVPE